MSITDAYGIIGSAINNGSGTITNAYGIFAMVNAYGAGPITNGYGLYVANPLGTVTNSYAVYTGGTTKSYFGGNVGIGTTSPWRKLSVTGTVGFDGLTTSVTGNAVCITTNKEITDAGAASCVPSSIRFKENINELPLGTALDELRKMSVKTFTYKKEYQMDTQEHIGLIAEDLEIIDPRLVVYNAIDGKPWSIHFEELTGLLVQATQALDTRISALEANAGIVKDATSGWSIDASGKLSVEELEVKGNAKIGSPGRRSGVTLYDDQTGTPYCLTVSGGLTKTTSGECGMQATQPQPSAAPPPANQPISVVEEFISETSTATSTISTDQQTEPMAIEPIPQGEATATPEQIPIPEPQPEPTPAPEDITPPVL